MSHHDARSRILDRLRIARLARERTDDSHGDHGIDPPAIAAPDLVPPEASASGMEDETSRVIRFAEALERVSGICHRATSDAAASDILLSIIRDRAATSIARSDDDLVVELLEGVTGGFELLDPDASRESLLRCELGITLAGRGVAEYGTVMMESGDAAGRRGPATERNRIAALLPEAHVAILPASRLVETWDEALSSSIRADGAPPPTVTFATGPSRTADIELELVLGVHGPRGQHVLVLEHR